MVCTQTATLRAQPVPPSESQRPPLTAADASWRVRYDQQREQLRVREERPSFVAPLVLTASGVAVAAWSLALGLIRNMSDCLATPLDTSRDSCDRDIETPFIVTASVGGAIGLVGGAWLIERLIARADYQQARRMPHGSLTPPSLQLSATFGGVTARLTF